MDDGTTVPRRGTGLDGWSTAAALGLMSAALLLERLLPADKEVPPTPAQDLPPQSSARRDASPANLAAGGRERGRDATSPAEIPAKGWKDILWRVYANAEMEHHTARDTTTGAPKSLGARGARMADTVGAAEGA